MSREGLSLYLWDGETGRTAASPNLGQRPRQSKRRLKSASSPTVRPSVAGSRIEEGVTSEDVSPEELLGPLNELERKYAPACLHVAGRLERPLPHPRVSIIGTRHPSIEGLEAASRISGSLAQRGAIIVSGLAEGIDTAAHRAAIDAGGKTIAVLGTALSRAYPAKNLSLQKLIMAEHLAISQFPEGRPTQRENFVLRNRTMALISDASVIVESGESGGSLHQGWEAIRLGRPLFIRQPVLSNPRLDWPRAMASYGAIEFEEPDDILDFVPHGVPALVTDGLN